ncbi:hypothetical protein AX774_g4222 [Zancudomyces culisetae]|uniref:Uncharacterized protein n=1 Tax=Zancudomyces culisetae TaxID=1213189 RepID=A0A1R1PMV2_ZANCU|nr:hypothetical protein AX774_g4222 [Zancudomyces culisetae]|eukprot:OMH82295.1 hypothetical protein AX774_g4222 [Zancudomyces culisetae]
MQKSCTGNHCLEPCLFSSALISTLNAWSRGISSVFTRCAISDFTVACCRCTSCTPLNTSRMPGFPTLLKNCASTAFGVSSLSSFDIPFTSAVNTPS